MGAAFPSLGLKSGSGKGTTWPQVSHVLVSLSELRCIPPTLSTVFHAPATAPLCLRFTGEAYLFPNPEFHHETTYSAQEGGSQIRHFKELGLEQSGLQIMVEGVLSMCVVLGNPSTEKFTSVPLPLHHFLSQLILTRCGGVLGKNMLLAAALRTPRTGLL